MYVHVCEHMCIEVHKFAEAQGWYQESSSVSLTLLFEAECLHWTQTSPNMAHLDSQFALGTPVSAFWVLNYMLATILTQNVHGFWDLYSSPHDFLVSAFSTEPSL